GRRADRLYRRAADLRVDGAQRARRACLTELAMSAEATLPTRAEAIALGLTSDEYDLVVEKLGREPNQVELAMFSLLWSEHCAYKHSKKLLMTLPTEGRHVVMGPGENAGA